MVLFYIFCVIFHIYASTTLEIKSIVLVLGEIAPRVRP